MTNRNTFAILAIAAAISLAACSGKGNKDAASKIPPASTGSGINTYGSDSGSLGAGGDVGLSQLASQHSVYFDYDSSEFKPEGQTVIAAWSKYLSAHPTTRVRLEGNTDERGTREYNIALGERRGNTVAQALESRGVSAQQLNVVSFGEERPVALGHDEDSFAQNRRVDLIAQ